MTKGRMVLELLIYAKSAMKNFDQSEAFFGSHMTLGRLKGFHAKNAKFTTHDLELPLNS